MQLALKREKCRHPQPTLLLSNAILKHNQINDHKSSSSKQSNVENPSHIFLDIVAIRWHARKSTQRRDGARTCILARQLPLALLVRQAGRAEQSVCRRESVV